MPLQCITIRAIQEWNNMAIGYKNELFVSYLLGTFSNNKYGRHFDECRGVLVVDNPEKGYCQIPIL